MQKRSKNKRNQHKMYHIKKLEKSYIDESLSKVKEPEKETKEKEDNQENKESIKKCKRKKFNTAEKANILSKTGGVCAHCGRALTVDNMTIEHIFPIGKGGDNHILNVIALCKDCNDDKSNSIYSLSTYYKYIKPEHIEAYMEYHQKIKWDKLNKTDILTESVTNVYYYGYNAIKIMINAIGRGKRDKAFMVIDKMKTLLRLEKAYKAESKQIVEFILKHKNKYGFSDNGYDNEYKILNAIENGFVYTVTNKLGEIFAVIIFIKEKFIDTDFVQLNTILKETSLSKTYVMTLAVISPKIAQCATQIMDIFMKSFIERRAIVLMYNIIGYNKLYVPSEKYEEYIKFNGIEGKLQFFSIKGLRSYIKDILTNGVSTNDDKEIEDIIDQMIYGNTGFMDIVGTNTDYIFNMMV